ncbi:MAG: 30S ribosomal protein S2 [Thaumarchaeota archaeon]|nr:30S ribosomal protein S2 [Nitrososphaerota archaeon]|tara:strand:- start:3 stop:863 length:861 start_codon:yes stop_codon:yes gene_type:complete
MAEISLEDMLQAGVHFGHQTKFWNPKMDPFIFGVRNKIHIIDLRHTVELLPPALSFLKSVAQKNNKILFVATKRSASIILREEAERCGMPYVNEKWLGGMLTNYKTIRSSINRLENLLRQKEDGTFRKLTKKEGLKLQREIDKLQKSIGGVREMGGLPDALFVIDVKREAIAISEASKMGIPIVGIVDTNSSPEGIDYVIPGNDDAIRSITLFTRAVSDACLEGLKLATGLKATPETSGPKIIKKEEKEDLQKKDSSKKDEKLEEEKVEEKSKQEAVETKDNKDSG